MADMEMPGSDIRGLAVKTNSAEAHLWILTQRRIAPLRRKGYHSAALRALKFFLSQNPSALLRGEALGLRASIHMESGRLRRALGDMLKSRRLSKPHSFARYVREAEIALIYERMGSLKEAQKWYRAALTTCVSAPDASAGGILRRFLILYPESSLSQAEKDLCRRAIRHSQEVLGLKRFGSFRSITEGMEALARREARAQAKILGKINQR